MEFTEDHVHYTLNEYSRRLVVVEQIGGVSLTDYVNGIKDVPSGWVLDYATEYYVPPHIDIDLEVAKMKPN